MNWFIYTRTVGRFSELALCSTMQATNHETIPEHQSDLLPQLSLRKNQIGMHFLLSSYPAVVHAY